MAKLGSAATLIVSDSPGALENGSCINFVMIDDKIKYEVNQKAIEDHKLKATLYLMSNAINN
ncbi:MAG: YfiR family protein [Salinivirgaceae bacterium]|nr:YfiR family protein [Salinivirgaceae bacterium]